jgi:hypothetical protein
VRIKFISLGIVSFSLTHLLNRESEGTLRGTNQNTINTSVVERRRGRVVDCFETERVLN